MSIRVETEWWWRKGCQECRQGTSKQGRFESVVGKDTGGKGNTIYRYKREFAWKAGVKLQGVEGLFYYAGVQVCSARAVVTEGGVWMWEVDWGK